MRFCNQEFGVLYETLILSKQSFEVHSVLSVHVMRLCYQKLLEEKTYLVNIFNNCGPSHLEKEKDHVLKPPLHHLHYLKMCQCLAVGL